MTVQVDRLGRIVDAMLHGDQTKMEEELAMTSENEKTKEPTTRDEVRQDRQSRLTDAAAAMFGRSESDKRRGVPAQTGDPKEDE